jgi:Fe-S oxidoreductase
VPRVANGFTRTRLAKLAAGVAPDRRLPPFARHSLQSWAKGKPPGRGRRVILWPDTFTNYFEPAVGIAAYQVLEGAGFAVTVPRGHVCCGRPLYDYGFLKSARRYLERTIDRFRDEIRAGTPIVGVEPSCVAVFRDELPKMLPDDEDASRLAAQTFHLAEFLVREEFEPPSLERTVLLQPHCHANATGGVEPEHELLERMGVELESPDSGCCGMAGAWGYEKEHYEVSQACGERALFPAVREAADDVIVVADGFSCRHQIEQGHTGRGAIHVAQLLELARNHGAAGPPGWKLEQLTGSRT